MEETSPEITSFVVRFVHSGPPENVALRGSILNVQTNQEQPFLHWEEAVAFIRRYVVLGVEGGPGAKGQGLGTSD
ncbi:MAG: hypothetical protein KA170_13455 [Candidatus Promineofilum sp.]|nr:hypothetical protein [Promineifilum sp.]